MNKTHDYVLNWIPAGSKIESKCQVQIFESVRSTNEQPERIMIVTELPDNPGRSVTNGIEEIVSLMLSAFCFYPDQVKVIEHYIRPDQDSFDYVRFAKSVIDPDRTQQITVSGVRWTAGNWPKIAEMIGAPGKRWSDL